VQRTGLWLRLFVGLLLAVIPPILFVVAVVLLSESVLTAADPNLLAIGVVVAAIVWAAVLAIAYARVLGDDFRSFVSLAERGETADTPELGGELQRLAGALEERNRQITTLASEAIAVPIDDDPVHVVRSLVSVARTVTRDGTWRCAVLDAADSTALPPGSYGAQDDGSDPSPIGDIERWAAVAGAPSGTARVDGPWGAFVVVGLSNSDRLRAILLAPWEGREQPSAAEVAVLSLIGQHAGAALDHSLLYAQVRTQAEELHRMAGIQADFLRGVTHDLQTPLTSIAALATELRASPELGDASRSDLDTISHQADRLRRMVSQLLVTSRLEAGVLTPASEVFAVRPLVERTWKALRPERPFTIRESGTPHLAVADPDRLEQVLWAILDNGVKYSPEGSPLEVGISSGDGRITVTVHDQGAGMDPETRARAFEQFYRSTQARRHAPDGSGVGLYAARGLMEAMGGTIDIESSLGTGTSVRLSLPAEDARAEAEVSTSAPAAE
jgi:signal transduction histidine kinase